MTAVEELEAAHAKAIRKLEKEKKRAIKAATDEVESAHRQAIKSLEAERHAAVNKVTEGLEVAHRKIVQRLEDALKEAIEKNDVSNDKSINKKESANSVTLEPRQNGRCIRLLCFSHVSKPAGTFTIVFDRSNIMPEYQSAR